MYKAVSIVYIDSIEYDTITKEHDMLAALIAAVLAVASPAPSPSPSPSPSHSEEVYADTVAESVDVPDLPTSVYDAPYTCQPVPDTSLSSAAIRYLVESGWTEDPAGRDGVRLLWAYGC